MPSVKCASCGHRNSRSATACANCGDTLTSWPKEEIVQSLIHAPSTQQDDVKDVFTSLTAHKNLPALQITRTVETNELTEDELPYQTKIKDTSLDFYQASGFAPGISTDQNQTVETEPEPWKTDKLPLVFSLRKPDLVGTIIHIESREQSSHDNSGLLSAVLSLFAEIIWIIPNSRSYQQTQKDSERITITRIRIRTNDRQIKDAHLRGEPQGANIALGDIVSLWGRKNKGALSITKGYDHTSKSSITSDTKKDRMLPALIMLALVLLVLYLYPTFSSHIPIHISNVDIPSLLKNLSKPFEHK